MTLLRACMIFPHAIVTLQTSQKGMEMQLHFSSYCMIFLA